MRMTWILFALGAALFYSAAGMVTKYSIDKNVRDPDGIVPIHAGTAFMITFVIWAILGFHVPNSQDILTSIAAGVAICLGALAIFKAYKIEDASTITLLGQVSGPLTLVLGYIFLHEGVVIRQAIGRVVILFAVFLVQKAKVNLESRI